MLSRISIIYLRIILYVSAGRCLKIILDIKKFLILGHNWMILLLTMRPFNVTFSRYFKSFMRFNIKSQYISASSDICKGKITISTSFTHCANEILFLRSFERLKKNCLIQIRNNCQFGDFISCRESQQRVL